MTQLKLFCCVLEKDLKQKLREIYVKLFMSLFLRFVASVWQVSFVKHSAFESFHFVFIFIYSNFHCKVSKMWNHPWQYFFFF